MLTKSLKFQLHQKEVFVDCTFGGGGYSNEFLKFSKTKVVGIDRDPSVISIAKNRKKI